MRTFVPILVLLVGPLALGQTTTTYTGTSYASWFNSSNWDNGVPSSTKIAVIPTNKYCAIDGSGATAYAIQVGGALRVNSGYSLSFANTTDATSTIDGEFELQDDTTLSVATANHILSGGTTGVLFATASPTSPATISIASGKTLRNELDGPWSAIVGTGLVIEGPGTLSNYGNVFAVNSVQRDHGKVILASDCDIITVSTSKFAAAGGCGSSVSATIQFDRQEALTGDIGTTNGGIIQVNADLTLCGELYMNGQNPAMKLQFGTGASLTCNTFDAGGSNCSLGTADTLLCGSDAIYVESNVSCGCN